MPQKGKGGIGADGLEECVEECVGKSVGNQDEWRLKCYFLPSPASAADGGPHCKCEMGGRPSLLCSRRRHFRPKGGGMAVRSLSRSPTKKKGKIPPPPCPFLFPRMGEGEFFCRRTAPSIANIFCAIWGSQLFSHFSPQTVRNSSEKWQERNGCAHCRALYIFCFFRTLKVPLTFCLFSCSLKAPMEMCWTVGKHYKPESFSSCRLMGSRKSGTIKFLPPPVSFGQNPPLLAKRRKKSRVGCTKHKEAKADSMEDGRRREAPLSFGECPKKEALARNAEEKKKRIKKRKSLVLFLCWKMEKKKRKVIHARKVHRRRKEKNFSPPPFSIVGTLLRPFLSTFPSSLPSLQIAKTAAPFPPPPIFSHLSSARCPQPPPHEREGGSLSGNLNHPFPSYEGPFSSQPLFSSSCPIQAKASAEGQGGGGGGRRRREKRSWFWSSSSSSTAPLQPPSLHRPSTMEKLFFASHPSSVPYLLLLLFPFPFFPPCPLLLPFSIFQAALPLFPPAKWERKITVLADGGCKKGVSSSSLDRTELGKTNSFFFRAISSIHSE